MRHYLVDLFIYSLLQGVVTLVVVQKIIDIVKTKTFKKKTEETTNEAGVSGGVLSHIRECLLAGVMISGALYLAVPCWKDFSIYFSKNYEETYGEISKVSESKYSSRNEVKINGTTYQSSKIDSTFEGKSLTIHYLPNTNIIIYYDAEPS